MLRRTALLTLIAAAMAAYVAPAGADTTEVTGLAEPTPISAHSGRIVWSTFDPATFTYRLTQRVNGVVSPVPVPPRAVPFDVDLGPGPRGGTLAVYSRCRFEGGEISPERGCDVYAFDFNANREFRVPGVNSRAGSEYRPSVWGGRIAFARSYPRPSSSSLPTGVFTRPLESSAPSRRLSRLNRVVQGLDLRGRRVVYGGDSQVRLVSTSGRTRRVLADLRGDEGNLNRPFLTNPVLAERAYFGLLTVGEAGSSSVFVRHAVRSGRTEEGGPRREPGALFIARDGDALFYLTRRAAPATPDVYEIRRAEDLSWKRIPRPVFPPGCCS